MKFRVGEKRQKKTISFNGILSDLIEDLDLKDSFVIENIRDRWSVYSGNILAAHSQPDRIFKHTLFITVDHSVYANELSMQKRSILKKVRDEIGSDIIGNIKFEVKNIKWKNKR